MAPTRSGRSRRRVAWSTALVVVLTGGVAWTHRDSALGLDARGGTKQPVAAVVPTTRPNILLVVADDQAQSTFSRTLMPNVFSQIVDQGVKFDKAFVNTSLCCPSRSQMLTGLYATDTNVSANFDRLMRPTLVQALHDSGYRTLLAGKYLNSHPCSDVQHEFDEWYCYGEGVSAEKDPVINVNGTDLPFSGYSADILASYVSHFIATTPADQPFLAMYTPKVPHAPANDDRFDSLPVPNYRPPNFDEDTTADGKPAGDQRGPLTDREIAQIDANYRDMYRSSRGLDNAVGSILSSLGPRAANTEVIYISDNGFFYGEHRKVQGKLAPYQESVNVPMVIRDPAVHATADPVESQALVENVDIPATIAQRAGIPWHADGTSLVPLLAGSVTKVRDAALIEHCISGAGPACWPPGEHENQVFVGVVTDQYKYVEYDSGERTLYDLDADPYELANHADQPAWAATQSDLAATLAGLRANGPPDTTIVTGPSGTVDAGQQRFTYFSPPLAATYSCRLSTSADPGSWAPCDAGGDTIGPLAPGTYTFAVAGTVDGAIDPAPAQRTFTVDAAAPTVSVADTSISEGLVGAQRHLSFTLTLSHASTKRVTVEYRTDDGTAQSPDDFTAKSGVIAIAAHQTSKVVTVPVKADRAHEADEWFSFALRNPVGAVLANPTATGTIVDDDAPPSVSVGSTSVTEGTGPGATLEFPVQLSGISGLPVTLRANTSVGTAKVADFVPVHTNVHLAPGQLSTTVAVPLVGDALSENDEKLTLSLASASGASIGTGSAQGTILDDDALPAVTIGDASVVERDTGSQSTAELPVTLSAPAGRPVVVSYATADGSATAPDDYTASSGRFTLKPGVTTASIPVPVAGDDLVEGDEQFTVTLTNPLHATIDNAVGTATILDDESPPVVSIADASVLEGDTGTVTAHFAVTLTVPSTHTVTVDYATADGTATAPDDYTGGGGTVTFAPGQTSATVDIPVVGDTLVESDETFTVTLSDPTRATLGDDTATGTILDDDSRPTVALGDGPTVAEGDSGTSPAVFTVTLAAASTRTVAVDYTTVDGTATAPDDYLATSGTITIPAGSTSALIPVPVVGDTRYEPNEHFSLVISDPQFATLGTDTATATITDDDPPPTITLLQDVTVNEGDSGTTDAVFTAQLSAASGRTTTVDYATSDVTAVAPGDYTATSGTVTIAPGATSGTFSVPVKGDTRYEGEERFLVLLTGATNGAVSDDDFGGYGIIEDDDPPPVVSVADPSVAEGDSGTTDATFTVSIPTPSEVDTFVSFATANGSATAPDDYTASAGTVTIPAGQTSAAVAVSVNGDTVYEGNESFSLRISNPLHATLGTAIAGAVIVDDDPPPPSGHRVF